MHQCIYLAKAKVNITPKGIEGILSKAHVNNPKRGITGVLVYTNGYFIQVIEGEREAVETLMEKIYNDVRIETMTVLADQSVTNRMFADWSMGYIDQIPFEVRHMMGLDIFKSMDEIEQHLEKQHDWMSTFLREAISNLAHSEG